MRSISHLTKFYRFDAAPESYWRNQLPYADYLLIWNNFLWYPTAAIEARPEGREIGSAQVRSAPSFRPSRLRICDRGAQRLSMPSPGT